MFGNEEYNPKKKYHAPVLPMEIFFPHKIRKTVYGILKTATILIGLAGVIIILLGVREDLYDQALGAFFVFLSFLMVLFSIESFFGSYYGKHESELISSGILYSSKGDLLRSFLKSKFGQRVVLRTEIPKDVIRDFLEQGGREMVSVTPEDDVGGVKDLALFILEKDATFKKLLASFGIDKKNLENILDWVVVDFEKEYRREAWWWPEFLSKIPGMAKDWNFGRLFYLVKYGEDLATKALSQSAEFDVKEFGNEVSQLEAILSTGRQANALIIGEAGVGVIDLILEFVRKLNRGKIHPALEHKRAFRLNWNNLVAANKDKTALESEILNVLNEAERAGNIILVIENIPDFILSVNAMGIILSSLLKPYLNSSSLQLIATTDNHKFHLHIEKDPELSANFSKIGVEETGEHKTIKIIENTVRKIEKKKGLIFSYPAIKEIVTAAMQYFPGSVMPDGAIDLLFEIIASGQIRHGHVSRETVLDFVEMKTKIPLGKLESTEKEKLLHLESILHERIIGQEEAISVISNAMRRTRADIRNTKKPIGTFLFLGPTGVGKTETAKALSAVFFGDERFMMRLDMTEYQKADSLERLIGSFNSGKPGVLSTMLRESPYGVLLLDEFEKAEKDVLNLFLQILDEGFFSDMDGKKVGLRNVIIIATSNAASDYIFQIVKEGRDLEKMKDDIVHKIVDTGIFKPELINRFDASVIFHPLDKSQLFQIAKLMLGKLRKRLADKGIDFIVTDELAMAIATEGSNEIFGARPMNRYIQDKIEQYVAEKMIAGEIIGGSRIELKPSDLKK
jgi:ATP-dependent Clp protease ATP-binding subunit ClpC